MSNASITEQTQEKAIPGHFLSENQYFSRGAPGTYEQGRPALQFPHTDSLLYRLYRQDEERLFWGIPAHCSTSNNMEGDRPWWELRYLEVTTREGPIPQVTYIFAPVAPGGHYLGAMALFEDTRTLGRALFNTEAAMFDALAVFNDANYVDAPGVFEFDHDLRTCFVPETVAAYDKLMVGEEV